MKDILDKILDIFGIILDKLDLLSDKIYEQTKVRIDAKAILAGIIGVIIIALFAKAILGYVFSQL